MSAGTAVASLSKNAREWLRRDRIDWLIVAGLVAVALALRVTKLTDIPHGLHGDEAWTGLDAQRILDTGLIGPYVRSAVGQPAGPLYFAAPFVAVFGHTVFAVRFAMALLGVATIPIAYATFRLMFNRTVGAFAALLLSVSIWHIHYSRVAFMVISWPLVEMIVMLLFFLALRTQRWLLFGLTGLALGAGVYTYNAYPVFLVAFGVLVLCAGALGQPDLWKYGRQMTMLLIVAVLATVPLLMYMSNSDNDYFHHQKVVSVFRTKEWHDAGAGSRLEVLSDNARLYVNHALWSGAPDYADGAGTHAMVDRISLGLLVIGFGMAVWRCRRIPYATLVIMVLVLPLGTVVATGAEYRRTLGVVPFLAALEALPLAYIWEQARGFRPRYRIVADSAVIGILIAVAALNVNAYFGDFAGSDVARSTFAPEYTDAVELIQGLPGNPYVYFYANLWSFNYETRRYLAPKAQGEDRSAEYSKTGDLSLQTDRKRDVVYVFLGSYMDRINDVEQLYPGGTRFEKMSGQRIPEFRAYYLSEFAPRATPLPGATPIPTPTREVLPGGEDRDRTRLADLQRIQQALTKYEQKYQEFPTNGGAIQTFCANKTVDAGCRLSGFLDPLPKDPSGNYARGYFYSSNGFDYAIYAYRESDAVPECDEHPEDLANLVDVMCLKGP